MKVKIDSSLLNSPHQYRGIGTYTRNLIEAINKINPKILTDEQPDIVHYPYFDFFQLTLPLKKVKPTIVTIYDTTPLIFPKHFSPGLRGSLKFRIQKKSLQSVKAVITISENSKKDIVKYLGYPESKIFVTYLAPGKEYRQLKIKQKYSLPDSFVLYVGDVNWNKNVPGLIRAFAQIKDMHLVMVGKAFEDKSLPEIIKINNLINQLGLNNRVVRLGWVDNQELVKIYNQATVYCQPSFYEGFGLGVLEAMACGCPVACANTSSLPEVCGEAAALFNPYDINTMVKAINLVIKNRDNFAKKGLAHVKKFSWEKIARETIQVYEKIYQENQ